MLKKIMRAVGVLILVTILVVAVETVRSPERVTQNPPDQTKEDANTYQRNDVEAFTQTLQNSVQTAIGQPIEGYEPQMFMQVFPGLLPEDFARVDAQIGRYEYSAGELRHELGNADMIHSAAQAITPQGMATLKRNVQNRLGLAENTDVDTIIIALREMDAETDDPVACTADAKQCSDGSFVGRVGSNCEFAPCPETDEREEVTVCTDEMKNAEMCTMEYAPVCGLVEVQCVTAPCDPVPETFSNGCSACARGNVVSYTAGACESP